MAGKKIKKKFTESVEYERNGSRARKALHDMIVFNDALEEEMRTMREASSQGNAIDKELLSKMLLVKEKYQVVMQGLEEFDDQQEHLALVIYADAVQDVIKHISKQKRH